MHPKVSICMVTYNHQPFISQAIDSVLMQKTDFEYELIIGEDCSTDETLTIVQAYSVSFPERIKLVLQKQNVGATRNFASVLESCNGQYVALLEGDDYWTSPDKLQKQVEYLERHPNCAICYHSCEVVDKVGVSKGMFLPINLYKKPTSTLLDLIVNDSFMATCSVMFRARLFNYFPDVFFVLRNVCDWPLNVLNAEHGDIGFIDEVMSSYRQQSSDFAWSSNPLSKIMLNSIRLNEAFNEYFKFEYSNIFEAKIANYYYLMSLDYFRQGNIRYGFEAIYFSLKTSFSYLLMIKAFLIDIPQNVLRGRIKYYSPSLYYKIKEMFKLRHRQ
jgi:glycosyltransferase involved in cell wall biosynthesis